MAYDDSTDPDERAANRAEHHAETWINAKFGVLEMHAHDMRATPVYLRYAYFKIVRLAHLAERTNYWLKIIAITLIVIAVVLVTIAAKVLF